VCPNFFNPPSATSPFIMLVHHCHSFAAWDPVRYIQRTFFPEGFPAHPHRGFITVTYIMKGGFRHRDSLGVKQMYGASKSDDKDGSRYQGKHTQWLMTGAGLLHEEMWDIHCPNLFQPSQQELYQIWLNVPGKFKLDRPSVCLLGGEEETPTVSVYSDGTSHRDISEEDDINVRKVSHPIENNPLQSTTIVIAGEYHGSVASVNTYSGVDILHVQVEPGAQWSHKMQARYTTGIIYMRTGSVIVGGSSSDSAILPHHTAYLSSTGDSLTLSNPSSTDMADFMFLAGEDLNEPVAAQGSMVMNSNGQINEAYRDYEQGHMGLPWDHKLSDDEWQEHITKNPSRYKFLQQPPKTP
jgi:redox-sensitive bicupin YhaK (pirin superfamily)